MAVRMNTYRSDTPHTGINFPSGMPAADFRTFGIEKP